MEINGREVKFMRTVYAQCKIADICPEQDSSRMAELFSGNYQQSQRQSAKFMAFLSEGYEQNRKFAEPGYTPRPLTEDEALSLFDEDFTALFNEAFAAWTGNKPTIETEQPKGKKKAGAETQSN